MIHVLGTTSSFSKRRPGERGGVRVAIDALFSRRAEEHGLRVGPVCRFAADVEVVKRHAVLLRSRLALLASSIAIVPQLGINAIVCLLACAAARARRSRARGLASCCFSKRAVRCLRN